MISHSFVECKNVDFIEVESKIVVAGGWEEGGGRYQERLVSSYKIIVRQEE